MNKINKLDENIEKELNDKNLILNKTSEELFQNIEEDELIIKKIKDNFSNIFLVDVDSNHIEEYKNFKEIYKILKHYVSINAAEYQNIQIMIFKLSKKSLKRSKDIYKKNKAIYGGLLKPFDYKYYYIVGYFGGTEGRNNQYLIKQIIKNFTVQKI